MSAGGDLRLGFRLLSLLSLVMQNFLFFFERKANRGINFTIGYNGGQLKDVGQAHLSFVQPRLN